MHLSPTAKSGLLAAALVGGAFLLLAVAFAAFLAADRASGQPGGRPDPGSARGSAAGEGLAAGPVGRDEFRRRVLYRQAKDVIAAVGRPDETRDAGGTAYWTYRNRTRDPVTGRTDEVAVIEMQQGNVAVGISFR